MVAAMMQRQNTQNRTQEKTHFGFREVGTAEKSGLVRGVFDSVARRYDLMNDVMSAGMHRLWKSAMIDWLAPRPEMTLLDVAGGTGDIAFRFLKRAGGARAIVCDINESMLTVGRDRAVNRGLLDGIDWLCGNAEALPLADRSVSAYTIAFGIRNVTHIERALAEARRVLRPGGRFLCLEFSRLTVGALEPLYDLYSFKAIPAIGQWITDDRESYEYLVESIRRFPDQQRFAEMIAAAGLSQVKVRNLSGGIAAMHSAWRI